MRRLSGTTLSIRLFPGLGFAQGSSPAHGSIGGDIFPTGANGEPAVLRAALIVLHGPVNKETESDTKGAFAVDSLPPGTYDLEASAPGLSATLTVNVSADRYSAVPVEMNVSAVTFTTSPQPTQLKAMDCAFSKKEHHA